MGRTGVSDRSTVGLISVRAPTRGTVLSDGDGHCTVSCRPRVEEPLVPRPRHSPFFSVGIGPRVHGAALADVIERRLRPCRPGIVFCFGEDGTDLRGLAREMGQRMAGTLLVGCTTLGCIGPAGASAGGVAALGLGAPVRCSAVLVRDVEGFRLEEGWNVVARLTRGIGLEPVDLSSTRHCFVTLFDGLSGLEERLLAALAMAAPGIPLVGGSVADGARLQEPLLLLGGETLSRGAVAVLVEPAFPFQLVRATHHRPTRGRLVVTRCDPARRLVHEVNGRPAVEVIAELLSVSVPELHARSVEILGAARAHFGSRVRDDYLVRSMVAVQGQAVRVGGLVEEGSVLAWMEAEDEVAATEAAMQRAIAALPGEAAVGLLFNCGGRQSAAEASGTARAMEAAWSGVPCVGFHAAAQPYGSVIMNQALVGLVLGWPDER